MRYAVVILTGLLLAPSTADAQSVPKDLLVKLQRTACFGTCPVYDVTVDANGTVTYQGREHVRIKGRQTATIPRAKVAELAAAVDKSGFFDLKDAYDALMTDMPTYYVTVTSNGRTKTIKDYASAPRALTQLEDDIDDIAGTKRWVRIDVASMNQLFLDGRAPTGAEMIEMMNEALGADDVDVVTALLRRGVSAKAMQDGRSFLLGARSAAAVQALVAAGADPNATDDNGLTPLFQAAFRSVEVTAALLKGGARVETETAPPLYNAACVGNIGAVRLLLDAGANPARTTDGQSALACARSIKADMDANKFPKLPWEPQYVEDYAGVIALLEAALAKAKPRQD